MLMDSMHWAASIRVAVTMIFLTITVLGETHPLISHEKMLVFSYPPLSICLESFVGVSSSRVSSVCWERTVSGNTSAYVGISSAADVRAAGFSRSASVQMLE